MKARSVTGDLRIRRRSTPRHIVGLRSLCRGRRHFFRIAIPFEEASDPKNAIGEFASQLYTSFRIRALEKQLRLKRQLRVHSLQSLQQILVARDEPSSLQEGEM